MAYKSKYTPEVRRRFLDDLAAVPVEEREPVILSFASRAGIQPGTAESLAARWRQELNHPSRRRTGSKPKPPKPYKHTQRDAIVRQGYDAGLSYSEIGEHIGRSHERVRQIVKQLGLPPRTPIVVRKRERWQTELEERRAELTDKYIEVGYSFAKLEQATGIVPHRLRWLLPPETRPVAPPHPHGTVARYRSHRDPCRCDLCREAHTAQVLAERAVRRRATEKGILPPQVQHGTLNAYGNYGCRCEPCREVQSIAVREQHRRRMDSPLPAHIPHGDRRAYANYGCRCEPCTTTEREYRRQLKHRPD